MKPPADGAAFVPRFRIGVKSAALPQEQKFFWFFFYKKRTAYLLGRGGVVE
jgi:hypothetical protein